MNELAVQAANGTNAVADRAAIQAEIRDLIIEVDRIANSTAFKTAGVDYYSSHGIRFHIISAMYDAGIEEKEIQRLSGHTSPMMTRHYNKRISDYCEEDKIKTVLG